MKYTIPGSATRSKVGSHSVLLATIAIAVGFTNFGIAIVNPQPSGGREPYIVIGVVCVFVGLLVMAFANRHIAKSEADRQLERDRIAAEIMAALKSSQPSPVPFALYLRSFQVTGVLPERCDIYGAEVGEGTFANLLIHAARPQKTDFELLVAYAVGPELALVGLGRPGEMIGAGRFASNEAEWHDDIALLARNAFSIVFVPASSAGVLWELDYLAKHQLLGKTVICVPSQLEVLFDNRSILEFIARLKQPVGIIRLGLEWMNFVEYTPAGLKPTDAVGGPLADFALRAMLRHLGKLPLRA